MNEKEISEFKILRNNDFDFFKKNKRKVTKFHEFLIKTTTFAYLPHKKYCVTGEISERDKIVGFHYAIFIWLAQFAIVATMITDMIKHGF